MGNDEERLLEDTVFPYLYCAVDAPGGDDAQGGGARLPDVEADVVALDQGERGVVTASVRKTEELVTWLHAIGTPAGFYLFQSLLAQSKLLQSACLRVRNIDDAAEIRLPLIPWVRGNLLEWTEKIKAGEKGSDSYEVLIKAIRTWLSLDKGIGVISGESGASLRLARNHMALLDRWIGGTEDLAVSLPEGSSPEAPACPLESGLPIGTRSVTRSAAKAGSYLYLLKLDAAAKALEVAFDAAPYALGSAFELPTLALYDKKLVGRLPEVEAPLLTFLAASDLALFTPLHPLFASLRQGLRWDSLHPGGRLRQILAVIADRELRLESRETKDYFAFTSTICDALGWPEVPRFLDAGRKLDPAAFNQPAATLFRAACEAREEKPAAFLDPLLAAKDLSDLMPPTTTLADVERSADADQPLALALEAELYALGFQLLHAGARPDFVCRRWRAALTKVTTPADMVKEYFGIEP